MAHLHTRQKHAGMKRFASVPGRSTPGAVHLLDQLLAQTLAVPDAKKYVLEESLPQLRTWRDAGLELDLAGRHVRVDRLGAPRDERPLGAADDAAASEPLRLRPSLRAKGYRSGTAAARLALSPAVP